MLQDPFHYGQEAFAFIEELDRLSTPGEVMNAMEQVVARFGFEALIFTGIDPEQPFDCQVLANRWPSEFFELYTRNHYIKFDPIARLCRQSSASFEWSELSYAHERDPRALEVMARAAQFRIKRGFVVPVHGPSGYQAAVSMAGVEVELSAGNKPAMHLMGLYAFNRVRRLMGAAVHCRRPLTHREREVLVWAAHGKSAWEIGEILHIAKRTVDEHAQSAFRKLGAVNRTQAVAIALRDRIIAL